MEFNVKGTILPVLEAVLQPGETVAQPTVTSVG